MGKRAGSEVRVVPEPLLWPGDGTSWLGVPEATLANWRYMGRGPRFVRVGRHVRYQPEAVRSWLAWLEKQRAVSP